MTTNDADTPLDRNVDVGNDWTSELNQAPTKNAA